MNLEKLLEIQINIINKLLNSLVNVLDINDANDVIKTGDIIKNVARGSLAP